MEKIKEKEEVVGTVFVKRAGTAVVAVGLTASSAFAELAPDDIDLTSFENVAAVVVVALAAMWAIKKGLKLL